MSFNLLTAWIDFSQPKAGCEGEITSMDEFVLTPPTFNEEGRFTAFRQRIEAFYKWKWNQECPWDGSESHQLSLLLKACPILDISEFSKWLYFYGCSEDIKPGERPRSFLPRIHNYSVVPLDRFGRSQDAVIQTAQTQRARRSDSAFERVRQNRLASQGATRNLPSEGGDNGNGNRKLAPGSKQLRAAGD